MLSFTLLIIALSPFLLLICLPLLLLFLKAFFIRFVAPIFPLIIIAHLGFKYFPLELLWLIPFMILTSFYIWPLIDYIWDYIVHLYATWIMFIEEHTDFEDLTLDHYWDNAKNYFNYPLFL